MPDSIKGGRSWDANADADADKTKDLNCSISGTNKFFGKVIVNNIHADLLCTLLCVMIFFA
jgi:hypothetical protein